VEEAIVKGLKFNPFKFGGGIMVNSNCKKCIYFKEGKCNGEDVSCICKFCPRNLSICITTRWCRETESPVTFED
jgi:tetrahydromethanopterin S-methyltransferase subunit E